MKIALDKNSYIEKTHKAFMGAPSKNTSYTLRNLFLVNMLFKNSDLRRYHSYNFETSQRKAFMDASMKHTNYTLKKYSVCTC